MAGFKRPTNPGFIPPTGGPDSSPPKNPSADAGNDRANVPSPPSPVPQHVAFDDTTPTLASASIGHIANRELLAIVSNFVIEARINGDRLESIYQEIRALRQPMPVGIPAKLLGEQRRSHSAAATHIAQLETWTTDRLANTNPDVP